jgi:magnesium chelatase family protein
VSRYQGKLSGPLLDRIDLHVEVGALAADELVNTPPGEATADIRRRVVTARERALARQGSTNQALEGRAIDAQCQLDDSGAKFLNTAAPPAWAGRAAASTAASRWPERLPTWPVLPRC